MQGEFASVQFCAYHVHTVPSVPMKYLYLHYSNAPADGRDGSCLIFIIFLMSIIIREASDETSRYMLACLMQQM
jgi:hypothetical protein